MKKIKRLKIFPRNLFCVWMRNVKRFWQENLGWVLGSLQRVQYMKYMVCCCCWWWCCHRILLYCIVRYVYDENAREIFSCSGNITIILCLSIYGCMFVMYRTIGGCYFFNSYENFILFIAIFRPWMIHPVKCTYCLSEL